MRTDAESVDAAEAVRLPLLVRPLCIASTFATLSLSHCGGAWLGSGATGATLGASVAEEALARILGGSFGGVGGDAS